MWLFLSICLFAQIESPQQESMLCQAESISQKYNLEVAKLPPAPASPKTQECLNRASVWFSIDLDDLEAPAFELLKEDQLWNDLRELGVQGVHLKNLKMGGAFRTGLGLDPKWGNDWDEVAIAMEKKGIYLIGDSIGNSTGLSADFCLALKNVGPYAGLYHLIEIESWDWKFLPKIPVGKLTTNIPWLTLQELQKKGYVPEHFTPYVKRSQWNTTSQVRCADGIVRRWIYLKDNESDPVINWLNSSFAGNRIATADTLDSVYHLGEQIIHIDPLINTNTQDTLSLWIRKLGSFSTQEGKGIDGIKTATSDMVFDTLTRSALLHALITQDTEALKLMYRLFLEEGVETKKLIHVLQPFDQFNCDWTSLIQSPRKKFQYYDELLTGEALRMRLLKEDAEKLGDNQSATWPKYCTMALNIKDFEKNREDITNTHLLLSFFYAMQPGAFSFSTSDLLGTVSRQTVSIMKPTENTLYASLPGQFKNNRSFAMQLKKILRIRRDNQLQNGELIAVPATTNPGLIVLVHRLKETGQIQLLAVNFAQTEAHQALTFPCLREATAIDLMTGLAEKKPLTSTTLQISLPPLSGKVILIQPKYY